MNKYLKKVSVFLCLWVLFLVPASIYLLLNSKGAFSLFLNKYHSQPADNFFKYATFLGDAFIVLFIFIFFLFIRYVYSFIILLNSAIVFLVIVILKTIFNIDRPSVYFSEKENLNIVDGVKLLQDYSFPSGHTSNAFCICLTIAFFYPNKYFQLALFFVALIVAVSRVYLFQHFLVDIYAGSIISVCITSLLMYYYFEKTQLFSSSRMQNSLLKKHQ